MKLSLDQINQVIVEMLQCDYCGLDYEITDKTINVKVSMEEINNWGLTHNNPEDDLRYVDNVIFSK